MNHLVIGGLGPFLIGLAWYLARRRAGLVFLITWPLLVWLCMMLAVAPDLPRLFGATELYNQLAFDPRCNVFFWHYTLDKTEGDSLIYPAAFTAILAAQLFVAWIELARIERRE